MPLFHTAGCVMAVLGAVVTRGTLQGRHQTVTHILPRSGLIYTVGWGNCQAGTDPDVD